jgi:ParB family chromosome partitioning protein
MHEFDVQGGKRQVIPTDRVRSSPARHSNSSDIQRLRALSETMKKHGLAEPIVVREVENGFEVVDGEQRLRASKMLGWASIEALVVDR